MSSIKAGLARTLPPKIRRYLQDRLNRRNLKKRLLDSPGGCLQFDNELQCEVASKSVSDVTFEVPVRSYRELRRFVNFGCGKTDLVTAWLWSIDDCSTLYDIGSANGLEGTFANARHNCLVCFVEPFVASVESILMAVTLAGRRGVSPDKFEVFAAACDSEPGLHRLTIHEPPIPGTTKNSFDEPDAYCRGGRANDRIYATNWIAAVSVDSLHTNYGQPLPTHLKIDVDGFEDRVIRGASSTLANEKLRSVMIEVNPGSGRPKAVEQAMAAAGFVHIESEEHYPGLNDSWDALYVRDDLADDYRDRLARARSQLDS